MSWGTYKSGLQASDLPDDDVLLVVARRKYLVVLESEASAGDLSTAAQGVGILLLD